MLKVCNDAPTVPHLCHSGTLETENIFNRHR